MADAAHLKKLHRTLLDSGKVIEAGWVLLRLKAIPLDAPAVQLEEMRNAFFAGAQHLMACINNGLDECEEPTSADLLRMTLIDKELTDFYEAFKLKHAKTEGRA